MTKEMSLQQAGANFLSSSEALLNGVKLRNLLLSVDVNLFANAGTFK